MFSPNTSSPGSAGRTLDRPATVSTTDLKSMRVRVTGGATASTCASCIRVIFAVVSPSGFSAPAILLSTSPSRSAGGRRTRTLSMRELVPSASYAPPSVLTFWNTSRSPRSAGGAFPILVRGVGVVAVFVVQSSFHFPTMAEGVGTLRLEFSSRDTASLNFCFLDLSARNGEGSVSENSRRISRRDSFSGEGAESSTAAPSEGSVESMVSEDSVVADRKVLA
mmetsp:Transcript_23336/g.53274  ORF Transcript_23336/g.53274 Transcript_23336/m.53274 type:complete len:222 (-) Transcript_23336:177-842(-)